MGDILEDGGESRTCGATHRITFIRHGQSVVNADMVIVECHIVYRHELLDRRSSIGHSFGVSTRDHHVFHFMHRTGRDRL